MSDSYRWKGKPLRELSDSELLEVIEAERNAPTYETPAAIQHRDMAFCGMLAACDEIERRKREPGGPFPSWDAMPLAVFDPLRIYRYLLIRDLEPSLDAATWPGKVRPIVWIMLNPSTADERQLDPTLTRCMDFTAKVGGTRMVITNLFAYRTPYPRILLGQDDPIGPLNDAAIDYAVAYARQNGGRVIAGWGQHGTYLNRQRAVLERHGPTLEALDWNKGTATPRHPLYIKGTTRPRPLAEFALSNV